GRGGGRVGHCPGKGSDPGGVLNPADSFEGSGSEKFTSYLPHRCVTAIRGLHAFISDAGRPVLFQDFATRGPFDVAAAPVVRRRLVTGCGVRVGYAGQKVAGSAARGSLDPCRRLTLFGPRR